MITNLRINEDLLLASVKNSPRLDAYVRKRARLLKAAAIQYYLSRAKNEGRLSATSPPRYVRSFRIAGYRGRWILWNDDPGALWVEFGAHAGGVTEVLKYRVLGHALDIVASGGMDG